MNGVEALKHTLQWSYPCCRSSETCEKGSVEKKKIKISTWAEGRVGENK